MPNIGGLQLNSHEVHRVATLQCRRPPSLTKLSASTSWQMDQHTFIDVIYREGGMEQARLATNIMPMGSG